MFVSLNHAHTLHITIEGINKLALVPFFPSFAHQFA